MKNHNKMITREKNYSNNRYKTDINFRIIRETRNRIPQALRVTSKSSSRKII